MYNLGDIISFTYKGNRKVKGEITKFVSRALVLKLHTDYIGKNEEWYAGETKLFNKKEMKNISIQ
jgi:hypothetical protein